MHQLHRLHHLRLILRRLHRLNTVTRGALASGLVVLAAVGQWLLGPHLGGGPFLLFFPAVVLSALLLNRGTGLYVTLLSAGLGVVLFMEPNDQQGLVREDAVVAVLTFLTLSVATTVVVEFVRSLVDHLDAVEHQKDLLFRELSHRTQNNLQIILTMLDLESAKLPPSEMRDRLRTLTERISIMASSQNLFKIVR